MIHVLLDVGGFTKKNTTLFMNFCYQVKLRILSVCQCVFVITNLTIFVGFFIAVQFFFTICFILTLIASFLTLAYLCTSRDADNFICLLAVLGGTMFVAGKLSRWDILECFWISNYVIFLCLQPFAGQLPS